MALLHLSHSFRQDPGKEISGALLEFPPDSDGAMSRKEVTDSSGTSVTVHIDHFQEVDQTEIDSQSLERVEHLAAEGKTRMERNSSSLAQQGHLQERNQTDANKSSIHAAEKDTSLSQMMENQSMKQVVQAAISVGWSVFTVVGVVLGLISLRSALLLVLEETGLKGSATEGDISDPESDLYQRPTDEESSSSESENESPVKEPKSASSIFKECPAETIRASVSNDLDIEFLKPVWDAATVVDALESHGIKASEWSKEAVADLTKELAKGKARLCKKDKQLVRVVDLVIVMLVYEPEHLVIQEHAHPKYKRTYDEAPEKTVRSRLIGAESLVECAQRCLDEKLGLATEGIVRVNTDVLKVRQKTEIFEQCPGLHTINRSFLVEATVISSKKGDLEQLGLLSRKLHVSDFSYTWEKIHEIRNVRKALREKWASLKKNEHVARRVILDYSLVPVLPWSQAEVDATLQTYAIKDPSSSFGMQKEHLQSALSEGKVSLGVLKGTSHAQPARSDGSTDRRLVCVSEKISMVVKTKDKQVIVLAPDDKPASQLAPPVLPHTEKLSTESTLMAALRLAQQDLKLSTPMFKIDGETIATIDTIGSKDRIFREIVVKGPWLPSTLS